MEMLSEHLPQLLLAWSIQWVSVMTPGPAVALILGVATSRGRGPAVVTSLGVACAAVILASTTVLGITAIFAQMAELMTVIRWVGAAYLAYLAYRAFRNAVLLPPLALSQTHDKSSLKTALNGFVLQLSNPKSMVFWLAIAAMGGVGTAPWPIVLLFVAGAFANSFIGHAGYALLLSSTPFRAGYVHARRWIEGTLGTFFTLFAFKLATDRS